MIIVLQKTMFFHPISAILTFKTPLQQLSRPFRTSLDHTWSIPRLYMFSEKNSFFIKDDSRIMYYLSKSAAAHPRHRARRWLLDIRNRSWQSKFRVVGFMQQKLLMRGQKQIVWKWRLGWEWVFNDIKIPHRKVRKFTQTSFQYRLQNPKILPKWHQISKNPLKMRS